VKHIFFRLTYPRGQGKLFRDTHERWDQRIVRFVRDVMASHVTGASASGVWLVDTEYSCAHSDKIMASKLMKNE